MTAPLSLIPDCGGPIAEIMITLPLGILSQVDGRKAAAMGNLAASLPREVTLYILTDDPSHSQIARWLEGHSPSCDVVLIAAGAAAPLLDSEIWSQDAWLIGERDGRAYVVDLTHTDRPGRHGCCFAAFRHVTREVSELHLAGGNMLTGSDFRILGAQSVELTRGIGPQPRSFAEALAQHAAMDPRRLSVFGFPLPMRGFPEVELRQQPHHLDLVLSVTGLQASDGRPLLLLADPRAGQSPDTTPVPGWAEQLDASAARLAADGFSVMRNPVPYVPHARFCPNPSLRAYNNVFLENAVRPGRSRPLVWLPQFADLEPALETFDRANREIWEGLGFESVPVFGWSALVRAGGAIRCASKIVRRLP